MGEHVTDAEAIAAKAMMEGLIRRSPRVEFYAFHYYEICRDACALVKEGKSEVEKIRAPMQGIPGKLAYRLTPEGQSQQLKIRKQESVAIAFAALCLEACIWDYAACHISKKKKDECLKQLNLVGKWIIIPELLCGSDITKVKVNGVCLLDRLRKLKKARNDLVHAKSKPLPKESLTVALKALAHQERQIAAEDAFGLITLLLGELEKVDKTNWWFFKSDPYRNIIAKS